MRPVRIVAVVQQRMQSTRLPYKAMLPLAGKPMTQHILERLKRVPSIHEVVLAVPEEKDTKMLLGVAEAVGVPAFIARGMLDNDLIGRHILVAQKFEADLIVRVPGDNPCSELSEVERIIETAQTRVLGWKQLFSNIQPIHNNRYPDGIGAEVYHLRFMQWLNENIHEPAYREHPHLWAHDHKLVWTVVAPRPIQRPGLRLDINTQDDYEFLVEIFDALYPKNPYFGIRDILEYLDAKQIKQQTQRENDLAQRSIPAGE